MHKQLVIASNRWEKEGLGYMETLWYKGQKLYMPHQIPVHPIFTNAQILAINLLN